MRRGQVTSRLLVEAMCCRLLHFYRGSMVVQVEKVELGWGIGKK